jgi:DNA-binding NtrC family response regulator
MIAATQETVQVGARAVWAQGGPRRGLIVEDDHDMRRLLADFLRGEGFRVDQAGDGAEALRRVSEEPFESVVLDKNLPGPSGLEILPLLHALAPGIPVIVITAFGDERTVEEAFARGAYDIFLKPFSLDDLLNVLRRAGNRAGETGGSATEPRSGPEDWGGSPGKRG